MQAAQAFTFGLLYRNMRKKYNWTLFEAIAEFHMNTAWEWYNRGHCHLYGLHALITLNLVAHGPPQELSNLHRQRSGFGESAGEIEETMGHGFFVNIFH